MFLSGKRVVPRMGWADSTVSWCTPLLFGMRLDNLAHHCVNLHCIFTCVTNSACATLPSVRSASALIAGTSPLAALANSAAPYLRLPGRLWILIKVHPRHPTPVATCCWSVGPIAEAIYKPGLIRGITAAFQGSLSGTENGR